MNERWRNDTETTQGDHARSTYYANKPDADVEKERERDKEREFTNCRIENHGRL